jgi:hypothetical protein
MHIDCIVFDCLLREQGGSCDCGAREDLYQLDVDGVLSIACPACITLARREVAKTVRTVADRRATPANTPGGPYVARFTGAAARQGAGGAELDGTVLLLSVGRTLDVTVAGLRDLRALANAADLPPMRSAVANVSHLARLLPHRRVGLRLSHRLRSLTGVGLVVDAWCSPTDLQAVRRAAPLTALSDWIAERTREPWAG